MMMYLKAVKEDNMAKPMISAEDFKLQESLGKIKHVIIVMSGKGGVGKSTVSSNIACTLAMMGYQTGNQWTPSGETLA